MFAKCNDFSQPVKLPVEYHWSRDFAEERVDLTRRVLQAHSSTNISFFEMSEFNNKLIFCCA